MLDERAGVARKIRSCRQAQRLSLRELGRRLGTSHAYLYQVESGLRPLAPAKAGLLERVLGIRGLILSVRRGRPPLSLEARRILRELRRSKGLPVVDPPGPRNLPAYPRAERGEPRLSPFGPTRPLRDLERARRGDQRFWRLLNSLRFDSGSEKALTLEVGLGSQTLTGVSPIRVGCGLRTVSGKTGKDQLAQAYPAFLLEREGMAVAWFVQPCVYTGVGFRWPDNLLVVARNGLRKTLVVEVDGLAYHRSPLAEAGRDRELGVPVLHLHPGELCLDFVLDWAQSQLGP